MAASASSQCSCRLQQGMSRHAMDGCTPPSLSERLARDRAGPARSLRMRRRFLRTFQPRPRHLRPSRRPLRADQHCCSPARFTLRSALPEPSSAATAAAAAELHATAAAMYVACGLVPVRIELPCSIAARAAAAWLPTRSGRRGWDGREAGSASLQRVDDGVRRRTPLDLVQEDPRHLPDAHLQSA